MNFLPLVSALGINPNIWQNNDLFFDMRNEGLMYQNENDVIDDNFSELFGYPHLAHPTNHFDITPFEAVYADPQTYEHIKMQKSVEDQNLNDEFLVHLRNFILDEVEADIVALQNQTIGENHVQDPNYKYRAWYKAKKEIHIGREVTSKTDKGDYIIQSTGAINVRAGDTIIIKSGFHAQAGSDFHAQIWSFPCDRPRGGKSLASSDEGNDSENSDKKAFTTNTNSPLYEKQYMQIIPNPNEGNFELKLNYDNPEGLVYVYSLTGSLMHTQKVISREHTLNLNLDSGIYIVKWSNGVFTESKKVIIR